MKLFNIFKKKSKRNRFRDRDSVFFTMTDENGISYVNMSDTIDYIPVRSALNIGKGGYIFKEPGVFGDAQLLDETSLFQNAIVSCDLFSPAYANRFKELMNLRAKAKNNFPEYHFERSTNG